MLKGIGGNSNQSLTIHRQNTTELLHSKRVNW